MTLISFGMSVVFVSKHDICCETQGDEIEKQSYEKRKSTWKACHKMKAKEMTTRLLECCLDKRGQTAA